MCMHPYSITITRGRPFILCISILLEIYFQNVQLEGGCCKCEVQDLVLNETSFMIFTLGNIDSVHNNFVMDEDIKMKFQYKLTKIYIYKDNY